MMLTLILAAGLMSAATPQEQVGRVDTDLPAYWRSAEGWRVFAYPDEEMCDIGMPTENGEYVTIGFRPKVNAVNFYVSNQHATSLHAGDIKRLSVVFASLPSLKPKSIHNVDFTVMNIDGKIGLSAPGTYPEFLDDFSTASIMLVATETKKAVAAVRLTGSAEAVKQLRACAMSAAHMDPKDPFLQK